MNELTGIHNRINEMEHWVKPLQDELYRVRTTQCAAAHALDTLRQQFGLDLIPDEHPMDTATRITREAAS